MKPQTVRTKTVVMPAFLAGALINGDLTGIGDSPEDLKMVDACHAYCSPGHIVSCGEAWFQHGCYPITNLGLDVAEYTVLYFDEV